MCIRDSRGGKHTQWEGGVRAISVVKWPGKIKPGTESIQLTSYIDVLPTIENIVGLTEFLTFSDMPWTTISAKRLVAPIIFDGLTALLCRRTKCL